MATKVTKEIKAIENEVKESDAKSIDTDFIYNGILNLGEIAFAVKYNPYDNIFRVDIDLKAKPNYWESAVMYLQGAPTVVDNR